MIIALVFIFVLLIIAAIVAFAYSMAFRPPRRTRQPYQLPAGKQYVPYHSHIKKNAEEMLSAPFEEVYITSYDGTKLFGRYYHVRDGAPLQIQFHGYKSSAFVDFSGGSKLARKNQQNVLVVDQRSHGKSEGNIITFGIKERRDVLSWIKYACERFGTDIPLVICGLSMGAATVLMAADMDLPANVKGIIADCPYSSPKAIIQKVCKDMHLPPKLLYPFVKLTGFLLGGFNLDESNAVKAVQQTNIPILLFHGEADTFVPCGMSKEIHAAASDHITLELFPDAGHGLCYMIDPKRYEAATLDFLKQILAE